VRAPHLLPALAAGLLVAALAGPAPDDGPTFAGVTETAGLAWGCGLVAGDWNLVETMGGGGGSDYLEFDPSKPGTSRYPCELIDGYPFCSIVKFEGQPSVLYRNRGDGTFEDASGKAGIARLVGKGMGVVPPTSTTTAGSTSSRRTTLRRTSCSGVSAAAASATWRSRPRWPSTR